MPKPRDICSKPDARRRLLSGGDELLKKNGQTRVEKTQCPKTNLLDLSDRTRVAGFLFPAVSDSADANIELFYDSGRSEKVEDVTKSTSNSIEFKCSDDLCCKSVKTLWAKVNGEEWTVNLDESTNTWKAVEDNGRRRRLLGSGNRRGNCRL